MTERRRIFDLSSVPEAPYASENAASDLLIQAQAASRLGEWDHRDPKEVIDAMISDMPDDLPLYTIAQLATLPQNRPSQLELYFLSRLPSLPDFGSDQTPPGVLSVRYSMDCLRDEVRTKRFLNGISQSVDQLQASTKGPLEVYDAGCGAIPVLSIYAALCSDRVRCTALEIHPESAKIARGFVEALGLENQIEVIEADAQVFKPTLPIDLLVSETMHSGLMQEPIVQIMSNLYPHLREGGITLPARIAVAAALAPVEKYLNARYFVAIMGDGYPVLETDWQEVADYTPGDRLEEISFSLPTDGVQWINSHLFVTSEVEVVPGQRLDTYQSLISMPQPVWDASTTNAETFSFGPADRRPRSSLATGPAKSWKA